MKKILSALLLVLFPVVAFCAATVDSVSGDVRAAGAALSQGARVESGTTVTTGDKSAAALRFDDGQVVVLNQNTEFRITEYRFAKDDPKQDRSVFEMLRGALRVVTGAIGQRNRQAFALRAPQATIGIRGTDFMVAIVNPLYMSVLAGSIGATNTAGTVAFGAGQIGSVATSTSLATAIPASALPAGASGAFNALGAAPIAPGAAAPGAVPGTAAAAAGVPAGAIIGIAAAVAAAAALAGSSDSGQSTTTHHK